MDKAERSVDTMQRIQETMNSAEAVETGDEGIQCTPSDFVDMEVDEGTIQNTLSLV